MTKHLLYFIFLLSLAVLSPIKSWGFSQDFYAKSSVLASGKWVKIRVNETGMYRIPTATLRSWGFNDPTKVRIYGYGGQRIADLLSEGTYVDDLPETPSVVSNNGIAFYAVGPLEWVSSTGSYYHGYLNPYSLYGYYFVTESELPQNEIASTASAGALSPRNTAQAFLHHEVETIQATEAGPLFVGESFSSTRSRSFTFNTPGLVTPSKDDDSIDTNTWMECSFFHIHKGTAALLKFAVDNTELPEVSTDLVSATSDSHYAHGSIGTTRHTFTTARPESFSLTVTYKPNVSSAQANLDYLSINYTRQLTLPDGGYMPFWSKDPQLALSAPENALIWDVTDRARIKKVNTDFSGGTHTWTATEGGLRSYVAFVPDATLPSPEFDSNVYSQNIHGEAQPVDMVIITPAELISQANRIANLHRDEDGMEVVVIDQEKIYNEFSSGTCDIGGLRKYLKMLYDIGADSDHQLKYVLLLGRATLDQRRIQPSKSHFAYRTTPWWMVRDARLSMTDNDGYGTDDFLAMLEDESGTSLGLDKLSVAVGRIPMLNAADGDIIIDKLVQYVKSSKKTGWKNRMILLADDEDTGTHLNQADSMAELLSSTDRQQHVIDKIYIDAYEKVGNTYPEARREMFRLLNDGAAWWIFTGHANNHSWTGENMLTYKDINTMYLRNLPFVLASTCDFLRWDGNEISGGEIMYKERYGGSISMISATRPVFISDNGFFLKAFGRQALTRDENGQLVRSGEAYRRTKNDIRNKDGVITSNTNRLRFVFMGDPAMAVATPSNIIEVTAINGTAPGEEQPTIGALANATVEGKIVSPSGDLMADFNGVVLVDIFDADYSVTTLAHGDGSEDIYDRHGDKLFSGAAYVTDGRFTLHAAMPSQIADNFREATMSLYAYSTVNNDEAVGLCRGFYVYGFEEPPVADTEDPVIKTFVLNHTGFNNGDMVNPSPMVIASVEDNVGINLSRAGVGQQMSLTLDDFTSFNDVASYYTPSSDGSPTGVINYPLDGLTEGAHTLMLRVFDTSGNTTSHTIDFMVSEKLLPSIFEVYTDANPAHDSASFYVRHDRPESIMEVSVTVFNLMGQPVWTGSSKGMSDNDVSAPVTWNLCDSAGRRVQRGIYLYRASITADGEKYQTASRRIAVAAQ